MIRIDVHPAGENPMNMPHAFHAWFAYGPGPYIYRGPRGQPFVSPHEVKTGPYTKKSLGNQRQADPVVVLGVLILPPMR
jgi:hypothetical protein